MPFITYPSPMTKGQPCTLTLSKSDLFALSDVAADAYFSVQANVKSCVIEFNSSPGNQKIIVTFDLSQATPTFTFTSSARARSTFLGERIILVDYDGGSMEVSTSGIAGGVGFVLS